MRTFKVPMTHPYIQGLTEFDLSFIEWSAALDDPKLREKIENTVYDDEFDEWYNSCLDGDVKDEYTDIDSESQVEYDDYADLSESLNETQLNDYDDWEEVE